VKVFLSLLEILLCDKDNSFLSRLGKISGHPSKTSKVPFRYQCCCVVDCCVDLALSAAVVLSFPTFLQGTDEIDSISIDGHHLSHDSVPVVQTVQDHQVATAMTPATLRLHALNQIHAKGLLKFSPLNSFFNLDF
jgi:hypothetical protein